MMLEIRDLSVSFKRYKSYFKQDVEERLNRITLDIGEGEIVALVGNSGAGKSLLAHSILGLLPPNAVLSGDVCFQKTILNAHLLKKKRGREIALLPQQITYLDPTATIGSLIRWSTNRAGTNKCLFEQLNDVGLSSDVAALYPHQLSGGMARRVLMAQAMAGGAKLLIADEPTVGLDYDNSENILRRLRIHADSGGSSLIITHDLSLILKYANRVSIMDEGKICSSSPISAFEGGGELLNSSYAKSMWQSLPQNGFRAYA